MDRVAPAVLLKWLRASGEPTRLRLLSLCLEATLSVSDLAQALGQSEARVSRHLKILCDAGLLERLRHGQWVQYRIGAAAEAASFARGLLAHIDRRDPQLQRDAAAARAGAAAPAAQAAARQRVAPRARTGRFPRCRHSHPAARYGAGGGRQSSGAARERGPCGARLHGDCPFAARRAGGARLRRAARIRLHGSAGIEPRGAERCGPGTCRSAVRCGAARSSGGERRGARARAGEYRAGDRSRRAVVDLRAL